MMTSERVNDIAIIATRPCTYGRDHAGNWYASTPNGLLANLAKHTVVEHEDGSITVSPSILVTGSSDACGAASWHGYLERGVWREC